MFDGCNLVKGMELLLKGCQFVSVDAKGRYGGLLLGWRTRSFHFLNAWAMCSGVCDVLYSIESQLDLCFINLYGPYIDREVFWNNLLVMECFRCPKLVFGGDLNFSLGLSEIWGDKARVDALTNFFINLLEGIGLIDISPRVSIPAWSNRRVGSESICKRLDRLLLSTDFLDNGFLLK